MFEPINRFAHPPRLGHIQGYDARAEGDLADRVTAIYAAIQPPATDPMLNFDERDLVAAAERAGFDPIHLELLVSIAPPPPMSWEAFLLSSANPRIPTIAQA